MVSSIRHSHNNHGKGSASHVSNSSDGASQRPRSDPPSQSQNSTEPLRSLLSAKQKGRKQGSVTKLKMPVHGRKVALEPLGDMQFTYVNYRESGYKYTTQLGVVIKREYPGLVNDKDQNGAVINTRPALEWADYFLSVKNRSGQTAGDRVLYEFWRLFQVKREDQQEADRVLENYLRKRVKDMMYQFRVDAVKVYYKNVLNQKLDDKLARPVELTYEQYMNGRVKCCSSAVWPSLCRYWCSEEFLTKRKRGQESRLPSDDIAQNRGGSRPFGETKQVLGVKFGPRSGTNMNTFSVMKSGMKNVDDTGRPGAISSRKAQNIVDEYIAKSQAAHPEGLEQEELDGQILYDLSGHLCHGRVAIANGAIKMADVRSAAKKKNPASSNVASYRRMAKDNRNLRHQNRCLHERLDQMGELTNDLILDLYCKLDKEVPENLKRRLADLQANLPTSSSHVGEDLDGEDMDGEDLENMDGNYNGEDMEEEYMYEEDEEDMDQEGKEDEEDMDQEDEEGMDEEGEHDRDKEDIDDINWGSNAGSNLDDCFDSGDIG